MDKVMDYLNRMYNGATLQVRVSEHCVARYRWSHDVGVIIDQREYTTIGCTVWHRTSDRLDEFFLMLRNEDFEVIGGLVEEPAKPVSHIRRVEL